MGRPTSNPVPPLSVVSFLDHSSKPIIVYIPYYVLGIYAWSLIKIIMFCERILPIICTVYLIHDIIRFLKRGVRF